MIFIIISLYCSQASVYVERSAEVPEKVKKIKDEELSKPERSKLLKGTKSLPENAENIKEQSINTATSVNSRDSKAISGEKSSPRNNFKDITNDVAMSPTTSSAARTWNKASEQPLKPTETAEPTYNIVIFYCKYLLL